MANRVTARGGRALRIVWAWIPRANGMTRLMAYGLAAYLVNRVRLLTQREHESAMKEKRPSVGINMKLLSLNKGAIH
jgi:hypothetical protein